MRVLLLGARGLLGSAFQSSLSDDEVIVPPREYLDIRHPSRLMSLVGQSGAEVVINCAAHTDVDGAEVTPDPAYAANQLLPSLLAQACRRAGSTMLHISSTGCYGGQRNDPYTEEDALHPTTVHHRSKAAGERAVRQAGCEALIVRTGWLFGGRPSYSRNFVWRRLEEAVRRSVMHSDTTQVGNPTYVNDVVDQCLFLLKQRITGTFNCVSSGAVRRFDYVSRIVAVSGLPCRVEASESTFKRLASVSPNESAINYRLGLMGLDLMPEWTVSLDDYIRQVKTWPEWSNLFDTGTLV